MHRLGVGVSLFKFVSMSFFIFLHVCVCLWESNPSVHGLDMFVCSGAGKGRKKERKKTKKKIYSKHNVHVTVYLSMTYVLSKHSWLIRRSTAIIHIHVYRTTQLNVRLLKKHAANFHSSSLSHLSLAYLSLHLVPYFTYLLYLVDIESKKSMN